MCENLETETETKTKMQEEVEIIEESAEAEKENENENKNETADKKLKEEYDALSDKYIRLYAEYENFRKRTLKEKEELYSNAAADVLKNIFPVLDSFERALQFSGEPDKVLEGLKMIETQFSDALNRIGVETIKAEGERFNPALHHAVSHEDDAGKPDNIVTEVLQKGYIKGDKVLRPAMVKVVN